MVEIKIYLEYHIFCLRSKCCCDYSGVWLDRHPAPLSKFPYNYDMVKFHSAQYIATNPRNYGRCLASVMYCQTPVDDYKEATDLRECWSSSWSCSIIICVLKSVFILLWPSHIFKGFEFCKLWITHQIIPGH